MKFEHFETLSEIIELDVIRNFVCFDFLHIRLMCLGFLPIPNKERKFNSTKVFRFSDQFNHLVLICSIIKANT